MRYNSPFIRLLIIPAMMVCITSCTEKKEPRNIERSFYYWKTTFRLSASEQERLDSLHVNTLCIKFFDVVWDEQSRVAKPVAKLQTTGYKLRSGMLIIPTVFITNECMQRIDPAQIGELAGNICSLTRDIMNSDGFSSIAELQFDCDWSVSTKDNYFLLLERIRSAWKGPKIPISATIRLHQVKFMARSGIPPVDKGLLMCYNMGNLRNPATKNSIIEAEELKKYMGNLPGYPIPLDVAFPLFDWKVLFRNNSYTGLIQGLPDSIFSTAFAKQNGNRFEIIKDTLLQGYELRKGDIIRNEKSDLTEILAAADEVNKRLKNNRPRVSLYHLDSVILNKYSLHELESIYRCLR